MPAKTAAVQEAAGGVKSTAADRIKKLQKQSTGIVQNKKSSIRMESLNGCSMDHKFLH